MTMDTYFKLAIGLAAFSILVIVLVAVSPTHATVSLPFEGVERINPIAGVVIDCAPAPCIVPARSVSARRAWQMKNELAGRMLLVDIRGRAEAYFTGVPAGIDIQAPFIEPQADFAWRDNRTEPVLEFRNDFVWRVDEALRDRQLKHDAPVVLICGTGERAPVAALLLQEQGYSNVFVVRDGFEGRVARSQDGTEQYVPGGWKTSGLPWSLRMDTRWARAAMPRPM